jgi:hypothetical protein
MPSIIMYFDSNRFSISLAIVLILISSLMVGCTSEEEEEKPTWPLQASLVQLYEQTEMTDEDGIPTGEYGYSVTPGISGGISPYTIRWHLDGVLGGTTYDVSVSFRTAGYFNNLQAGPHSITFEVMDATGEIAEATHYFTIEEPAEWVSDYKAKITFSTFTPRGIPSNTDIELEFTWDEENTGEPEVGVLCSTWSRSEGDDIELSLGKECIIDIADESHQVSITACARVDSESNGDGSSDVDIHPNDNPYASCVMVKDITLSGETTEFLESYNGLDDNDGDDPEYYHGHLVYYIDIIDDGDWEDA